MKALFRNEPRDMSCYANAVLQAIFTIPVVLNTAISSPFIQLAQLAKRYSARQKTVSCVAVKRLGKQHCKFWRYRPRPLLDARPLTLALGFDPHKEHDAAEFMRRLLQYSSSLKNLIRVEVMCARVSKIMGAMLVAKLLWHNDFEFLFEVKNVTRPFVIDGIRKRVHSVVVHIQHPDRGHFVTVVDISGRGDQWITLDDDKAAGPTNQPNLLNGMCSTTARQQPYLLFLIPES